MLIRWLQTGFDGMITDGECRWDNAPSAPMPVPSTAGGGGDPAPQSDATPAGTDTPSPAAPADEPEEDVFAPVTRATDDDDPAHGSDPITSDPRYKAIRKENRRLARRLERQNAIGGVLQGQDVKQVIADAEQFRRITAAADANPRLKALLFGDDPGDGTKPAPKDTRRQADTGEAEDINLDDLPFDTSDPVGQFFVRTLTTLQKTNQALKSRLEAVEGHTSRSQQERQQFTERQEKTAWQSATTQAAAQLPEEFRGIFADAVYGAYREAKSRNVRISPQQVIDHYLKHPKLTTAQKSRASAAAAQSIAEHNKSLPRRPAGNGTPAGARQTRELVADVGRRIRRSLS